MSKLMMSIGIAMYAFLPPLADLLTDTHVFHPDWLPHARMHTVWLLGVTFSIGLFSLYLLWGPSTNRLFAVNVAGTLSALILGAFFLSAATVRYYGGALTDRIGEAANGPFGIESNVFVFGIATVLLLLGWAGTSRRR